VDRIVITKAKRLTGELTMPGDKSISHRAIICGALASGTVSIQGLCSGDDTARTLAIFRRLGVAADSTGPQSLVVHGRGLRGLQEPADVLYAGNSGTTMRLMAGLLSAQPFFSVLTGDGSLNRRPMKRVVEPLRMMGARISGRHEGNFAPLALQGGKLSGITYAMPVSSAQVKSSLLLAGLYADGATRITEPVLSRDHTERMLGYLGAPLSVNGTEAAIQPGAELHAGRLTVPGDISSAAFFIAAGLLVPGSEILLHEIGVNPTRTGCIDILRRMGGAIEIINERLQCGEPVADILVRSSDLRAVEIGGDLIPRTIDELPILAVAAARAAGTTVIRDARELRVKESDRIATMTGELRKCGVAVEERDDGMVITGSPELRGAVCRSHGDHRVAMSMAIAGLWSTGQMTIEDCECIKTSFPEFIENLQSLMQ